MIRRTRLLAVALCATAVAACSSNVPVGFDSGRTLASRELTAPPPAVWEAARAELRTRGAVEVEQHADGGGVLRTGRHRIEIEPLEGGGTRLDVEVARYVGPDHEEHASRLLDQIVARVR